MSRFRACRRVFACLLVAALLSPWGRAAAGEFTLEPAYAATPLEGPAAAKGAVIWNHAINFLYGIEGAAAPVPVFLTLLRDDGWDVFRLLRPRMSEEPRGSAAELAATAARLKQQGYGRIVLAGQSGGAWLSLMAAGESGDIHAVIANAPAYYGTDHPAYLKNGFVLFDHIDAIRRGRIMITYFKDDPYDPGGRGPRSEELLAAHDVPHLVIDQPEGFSGHSAGDSVLFLRRFGSCMLAVAGNGPMPSAETCDSGWGSMPSADLPWPPRLTLAAPDGGPADRFLGKWYGCDLDGRELLLAIERAADTEVEAVYALGPGIEPAQKPQLTHRHGRIVEDMLIFAESGIVQLGFGWRPDGTLEALRYADGVWRAAARLHRLP
jgi:dienelactone hydrolase